MKHGIYYNSEGYFDPTAGAAMRRILLKERSDRRKAIRKKNREIRKQKAQKLEQASVQGGSVNDR